jgi:DNA-binding HxlR family transcriptional regulator
MPVSGNSAAGRLRAGGRALLLLADPVNVAILRQLGSGPLESTALLDRIDYVSRSTYFDRMRDLEELSLVGRWRRADVPPVAECWLAGPGERLLPVARLLDGWLRGAPRDPLQLGQAYATAVIKALAVGWGSTVLRWLAERPHSLTELEHLVEGFGYRKLERICRDLVKAELAERVVIRGRLSAYGMTPWGRRAAGSLAAAIRWEQHEIPEWSAAVTSTEVEGGLMLALPLIDLPNDVSGTCSLLVDADAPERQSLGGAVVRVAHGRPVSWAPATDLHPRADCWVRGTTLAWLDAVGAPHSADLRLGGDAGLAEKVIASLRGASSADAVAPTTTSIEDRSEPAGLR